MISSINPGRLVRYRLGTVVRDLRYDAADRLTSYQHYDASSGAAEPTLDQSFGYDQLGRLTSATAYATTWSWSYDASGNRTAATSGTSSRSYTIAPTSNRLTALSSPAASFTHDAAGNTLTSTDTGYTATYNLAGRLATLVRSGITTTYTVDAQGRRVRKFDSSGAASTVLYTYDQAGHLLGEYDASGNALREYIWLGDTPVAMFTPASATALPTDPPAVYFIHADHLNTPRVVLDTSNRIRWRWLADAFGTAAPETNPSGLGAFVQNLRMPGQYADAESGLFYNRFRDYDPALGRYVQSDPIGLGGGINTYGYVNSNSVYKIDPSGLETMVITSGAISSNPFGHSALAFTGQGVYSYGTADPYGSNTTDYISEQLTKRNVTITILNTTAEQELQMANYYKNNYGANSEYSVSLNNCANAAAGALSNAGVIRPIFGTALMLPYDPQRWAAGQKGAVTRMLPRGGATPPGLSVFNPR